VEAVAQSLLGCFLVRRAGCRTLGGRIVEVEAYGGTGDVASHAHRWPKGRARIMFGPAGFVYVYFTYGMHHCMNIVTGREGVAGAVLLRALEPVWEVRAMRRGAPAGLADHLLASGPGRLCRALDVDRRLNGSELGDGPLQVLRRRTRPRVLTGPRVGLSADDGRAWRYWVADSRSVTARRGTVRPGSRS
jgi:DNA-3-methyladenine glycosylase